MARLFQQLRCVQECGASRPPDEHGSGLAKHAFQRDTKGKRGPVLKIGWHQRVSEKCLLQLDLAAIRKVERIFNVKLTQ